MKNCLHPFTKWIFCLLAMFAIPDLTAQNVRDGFCDYAINASCGIAITKHTNKGGPNIMWEYQCNDYTFSGPEKIYKITTTTAGVIQVDLSIYEANIDMDLLLLSDNCSTPTCLAQAITSNANGKTEQIIYNNAPAGTYYVVVDSEKDVGTYDLLITCNPTSSCNLEYTVTPRPISCGGSKGAIDVAIAWGKAPFKIAWDNADNSIWNTYTTSNKNYTIDNLPAGVYLVKITDAMGCELMKNNIVITNSGSSLDATFSATDAPCGSSFGWINVDVANSSPPYWVTVKGPKSGTAQATTNDIVIKDMPPGNYEVSIEKGGCTKEGWVTVGSTTNLDFVAEATNASCGGEGSFWITIDGGAPTYTIEWWHKDGTSGWLQSSGKSFPISELKAGEYTIKITGKNGCSKTKKVTLGGGTLDFALEANAATCGSKGSVWVTITSGKKDFVVEWTGPTNGWKNTSKKSFAIDDLIAGNYEINIKDSKGCQNTKWITVNNSGGNLDFELEANSATCSEKGAIWVTVKNGSPTYTIEWWGPNTSKWATTQQKSFQLKDLAVGDYTVKITDSKGCSNTKTVKIHTTGNGLAVSLETLGVRCGALASLWIEIKNGTSKYGIDINGPGVNKWFEATSSKIQVSDLPAGNFTVKVTDANGCTGTKTITIEDKGGSLDVAVETTDASCGGKGSSWVTIKNGSPKFIIELWGPNNVTFWAETSSASFRLSDLSAGDYTLKITDKNGCSTTKTFKIGAGNSNMSMALEVNNASCKDNGRIWVTVYGGTAGYKLKWDGPSPGEANLANNGHQINNLKAGNYTLTVKDHYGCAYTKSVTVYGTSNNLKLTLEANNATCSQNGYLWAEVKNGQGPYQVSWTGAATGAINVTNAGFQIPDLPAGAYWVTVKDKNGCSITKEVTIANGGSNVIVDLEVNNGSCGNNSYVWVTIKNGSGPYYIAWAGPKNGEVNSGSNGYQISDLPKGWYKVTVKDKHGCKTIKDIEVLGGGKYTVTTQQTNATCGKNGEIWVDMNGGVAPFNLNLTGAVIGNTSTNGYSYHFPSVPPGTYTLTLQDATGCIVSKQLTITNSGGNLNASVETTNAVCGKGGAAWITVNGNATPYTINWTGPVTGSYISSDPGYQIQNLLAGDYTISVKDNYGCYTNKSITISNTGNSLNLSLEATNASCGQKGAIWTTITGGKADYTIAWSGPSNGSIQTSTTGNQIPNLVGGTYAVKVTDKNNCSASATITIGNNVQNFTISTESTNATCEQKGWAWITMNGGSPNYNISWSGPINGSTSTSQSGYRLDNLIAGTYTITVKEYSGCEATKTIIIYDNGSNLGLSLEATSANCSSKGSIWATVSGGTAGYTYSWTGPSVGSNSTSQTGYRIDNLSAGTYTVMVKDSKGCETSKSVTVGNNVQNFTISTESTNATCGQKGSAWIAMNGGSANYTISWSGPGASSGSISTSQSGYRLDNLVAGTYVITVKDANGCEDSKTIIIYDNGSDIILSLEATSATCDSKGSIWATVSGGTAGYSYSWTGPSSNSISTTQTGYRIDNLVAGTYTVTVKDSKGCETSKSITVGNNVQNFTISTESTNATCGQKGWAYITMNGGSPIYKITWSGPTSGSVNSSTTGYRLDNLVVGTYVITVKDANGCEDSKTIIIYDNGSDITLSLEATSANCGSKGSIWATISGGSAGYTYSWTGTATGSISTSETGYRIDNLAAGTYTVTVKDSKGCEVSKSVTVGNNVQNFTISTESTNAICGEKGWARVTMNGGSANYTISWSGPGASSGSISTVQSNYRLDNLVAGTYIITVKDANGCEDSKTVTIANDGSDITLTLEATNGTCGSKGSIWATVSGGTADYSYSWTGPESGSTTISQTGYRIENLSAGEYTVTVKDSKGCENSRSVIVKSIGGNLTVNLSNTTAVACEHDGTTYVSIGGGKAPYTINYVGETTGTVTANSNDYQLNLSAGDYTVFVKDDNGCEGSQKIKINDNGSDLAINLTVIGATCLDKGMLQVDISGGIPNYQINWSGNGLNETITTGNRSFALTDLAAGTYEIKVTDGIGCAVSKSITINSVGGNLGLQLLPKNGTCGQAGAIDVIASGGAANYTISWSGPTAGSEVSGTGRYQISGLGIGNYAVTVKDANGCEIKETVAINAGSAVDFNLTATGAACNKNGSIVVDVTAGAPNYAISWTGPSVGSQSVSANVYIIEGLIAGTYSVTIKDANDCKSTESVVVGTTNGSSLGLTLTNTNASCGTNGHITATVKYGEGEYTYSWTGPVSGSEKMSTDTYSILDLPAGTYTVSVIDKKGCSISKIIQVNTAENELALNVVGKNASCGQASSIQVTIANGVPNFRIDWSEANTGTFNTDANSYTITNVTNGETTVRVTDAAGCSKEQTVNIAARPNDVNFTYQSNDASCNNKGAIWLTISDGSAPYNIAWTGSSSGASFSADEAVQITDLDIGVYNVTVSDKSNCMITQTIEVKSAGGGTATNFAYKAGAVTCNVPGSVLVTMISGVAPYTIAWSGPTTGSRTAATTDIKIEDLVVGTYQVTVTSANGCGALTQSVVIEDKRVVLGISGTVTNGVCGDKGIVALSWSGDRDPYTISWTGESVGSTVINDQSQTITDLKDGSYTFTVTGFDGCTGQYQATINNAGTSTNADFTYSISAKKLAFSNLSDSGTYIWDFGDGNTASETNPIHTYAQNGTYTICLKVTNDCGTKEKCQTVTINAVNSTDGTSAKVILANESGPKGTVLQLPVRVENCTRIGTLSGTINLRNSQVAQINGLSPNAISPVYNDANHSFSYLAAGSGMNITEETILFYINVQLMGGVGESSTIDLSSLPVALELTCTEDGFAPPITPEVSGGRVSISTDAAVLTEVGGNILTYWGDGVADAMVTIRSADHEMNPMTSLDGDYAAESVPMGYEYEFTPSKATNPANGLSTFGLFLTQKYILGYQPEQIQSPYQVVAMDANCSGSLTTFDLFAMQQMLVGNLAEFPGCESWVFVDADHEFPAEFTNKNVFPYPNSHTMMLDNENALADFIGVKVGDVLGRALPTDNSFTTQATDRTRKVMPLQVSAKTAMAGETVEVHFQAQDFTEMVSFQLGVDFDPTVLDLVEFVPNADNELASALSGANRNHLKVSWYDPAGKGVALVANENLFTLKFVAKQEIIDVMELFTINNRTFASELHQQSNEAYRFKLVNKSPTNSAFKVHQNTPNPFMDATSIIIEMPTALDAVIVLHDQFGRTIQTIQQPLKTGLNRVNINRNQLSAGIYYYTVKAGDFAATKRMLIIE